MHRIRIQHMARDACNGAAHLSDVSTTWFDFPGVSKVGKSNLQLIIAAHQVVVRDSIKVTAETTHSTLPTAVSIVNNIPEQTVHRND